MRVALSDRRGLLAALLLVSGAAWAACVWLMGSVHHAPRLWAAFAMWAAMMVGMMVPPETLSLLRLRRPAAFLAGYLLPWMAFSLAVAVLHRELLGGGWLEHHTGALVSRNAAGALLLGAGLLQLTPLKRACLKRCRDVQLSGSLADGLRTGALSVVSCGVLMLVPFATGMMNYAAMALITGLLVAERAAPRKWPVSAAAGTVLAALGAWTFSVGSGF